MSYLESRYSLPVVMKVSQNSFPLSYILEKDYIILQSETVVNCDPITKQVIQDDPIMTENIFYEKYGLTSLQYEIRSVVPNQQIKITIPYSNKLTIAEARHSVICIHDGISQWRILDTTVDEDNKTFHASIGSGGIIGVCMNHYWYSAYTQSMADEFPTWTHLRQSRESNGQQFMNHFGMSLEEVHGDFTDIRNQKFIDKLDERILDWIYVYDLPGIDSSDTVALTNGDGPLKIVTTLREFFYNHSGASGIIDYEQRRLYALKQFGPIDVEVTTYGKRQTLRTEGRPHHLWNAFDEFGVLCGTPRLYLEKNGSYRERIKDVFRYVANSGDVGLTNALGRELNLIKRVIWKDDSKVLYLRGTNLDSRTVRVDGISLPPNMIAVDEYGHILIQPLNQQVPHTVTVIKGVLKYELHHKEDQTLYHMMFDPDGQASPKLIEWVNYINQVAPIMWGDVNWDEGFWDTIDKNLTGLGYLPNIWDSDISVWKDYKLKLDMRRNESVWGS